MVPEMQHLPADPEVRKNTKSEMAWIKSLERNLIYSRFLYLKHMLWVDQAHACRTYIV